MYKFVNFENRKDCLHEIRIDKSLNLLIPHDLFSNLYLLSKSPKPKEGTLYCSISGVIRKYQLKVKYRSIGMIKEKEKPSAAKIMNVR